MVVAMSAEEHEISELPVAALGVAVTGIPTGRRLTVIGELDANTSWIVDEALSEGLAAGDVEVDLTGLTFIDSSGIRSLLRAKEVCAPGQSFIVVAASPQAMRLIDLVGAAKPLGLTNDRSET